MAASRHSRRQLELAIVATILVLAAVGVWYGAWYTVQHQPRISMVPVTAIPQDPIVANTNARTQEIIPVLAPRLSDGYLVPAGEDNHLVIGVMIENGAFADVRPQFGLSQAKIVYEMLVEGGITRLLAMFDSDFPKKIGPVRSARPTYLEFISEYNGLYGHAGGSPEAMQAIAGLQLRDLSALAGDSQYFFRDTNRIAPHNLFTSSDLLRLALRDKNLTDVVSDYNTWLFKTDAKPITAPPVDSGISIDFGSGPLYQVTFVYDYATNTYQRYNGGELQVDANDNTTLTAHNVIVQIVPPPIAAGDEGRVNFSVTGEGKAYVARDGVVLEGKWRKTDRLSRTEFVDSQGQTIPINRGNTWVEIVPDSGVVTY